MRQLLRYRPAMRIAHDGTPIEMSLGQHGVQIRGERGHIIWAIDIAAFPPGRSGRSQSARRGNQNQRKPNDRAGA
jgi:hypothetical protein